MVHESDESGQHLNRVLRRIELLNPATLRRVALTQCTIASRRLIE